MPWIVASNALEKYGIDYGNSFYKILPITKIFCQCNIYYHPTDRRVVLHTFTKIFNSF